MKHTQGKWHVVTSGALDFEIAVCADDGGSVCHITKWPEAKANAELIASAPELLKQNADLVEALELAETYLGDGANITALKIIRKAIKANEK